MSSRVSRQEICDSKWDLTGIKLFGSARFLCAFGKVFVIEVRSGNVTLRLSLLGSSLAKITLTGLTNLQQPAVKC